LTKQNEALAQALRAAGDLGTQSEKENNVERKEQDNVGEKRWGKKAASNKNS
jgi:hypothetical protein